MFGRGEKTPLTGSATATAPTERENSKGRPTPTRREAEAAARARARAPMDKKRARQVMRQSRGSTNAQIRQGMKDGDERYLPARDKGPVRRFIRDWVDSRISVAEFFLPLLIIIMVLQYSGSAALRTFSGGLWTASILLVIVDSVWLRIRLRRELLRRFPDESLKGTTFYALLRVLQLRFMRVPKTKARIGQQLPEHYH